MPGPFSGGAPVKAALDFNNVPQPLPFSPTLAMQLPLKRASMFTPLYLTAGSSVPYSASNCCFFIRVFIYTRNIYGESLYPGNVMTNIPAFQAVIMRDRYKQIKQLWYRVKCCSMGHPRCYGSTEKGHWTALGSKGRLPDIWVEPRNNGIHLVGTGRGSVFQAERVWAWRGERAPRIWTITGSLISLWYKGKKESDERWVWRKIQEPAHGELYVPFLGVRTWPQRQWGMMDSLKLGVQ